MRRGLLLTDPWQVLVVGHFVPRVGQLRETLTAQLRHAQRAETAEELHCLVNRLRLEWGSEAPVSEPIRALEPRLRATWEARAQLLIQIRSDLTPEAARQLEVDLLELGILWANLRVRLASDRQSDLRRREALHVLAEAEAQFGNHAILERERQSYAEALRLDDLARTAAQRRAALVPVSAWEHYALGRSLFDAGDLDAAAQEFAASSILQPQDLWSRFCQGLCAYRLRHFDAALAAFDVCVALAPSTAECYYNRARSHAALGNTEAALADYNRALALDPKLSVAALNRGVLLFRQGRYPEALADFQRAQVGKASPAIVHYNLALAYHAQNDSVAARTHLEAALRLAPGEKVFRDLQCRLWSNPRAEAGPRIETRLPIAVQSTPRSSSLSPVR
jgi:tetratricopeptide (TPR) repeat protein